MIKKKRKSIVFVSSGLGNSILLVPLLKRLKKENNIVTIILNSNFVSKDFLVFNKFPFDNIIELNNTSTFRFLIRKIFHFDCAYLDFSSSSVKNLLIARIVSKQVIAMRNSNPFVPGINFVKAESNIHSAILNGRLVNKYYKDQNLLLEDILLKPEDSKHPIFYQFRDKNVIPVAIQISSANLKVKYKNWPTDSWIEFLKEILKSYPNFNLILLGDKNESLIGNKISNICTDSIINLVGKTNLKEVSQIINSSRFYIGLDSGLMHLAVAFNKPTFTIWGGSSYKLYGYNQFNDVKHLDMYLDVDCSPCNAWIGANTSRVKNPIDCPDNKCIINIKPKWLFESFNKFVIQNKLY